MDKCREETEWLDETEGANAAVSIKNIIYNPAGQKTKKGKTVTKRAIAYCVDHVSDKEVIISQAIAEGRVCEGTYMRCDNKNWESSASALPLLTVFQHFQGEPEENNGMNQCIDTVTPEHLEDRGRNTEKFKKKGRSVWAKANTHICLCGPPSPRKKNSNSSQLHITSTVFLPSKVLSCTHTQQARLLVHPLK